MRKKFSNVYEVLQWASLFLRTHGREEKVAEILLMHHTGMEKSKLLSSLRDPIEAAIVDCFIQDINKHAETGVPVQHLTGKEMFYGRQFLVNEHVLIPRPETEELVYEVIELIKSKKTEKTLQLADLGTGSGAIAVTVKLECPDIKVSASDISDQALKVAQENAAALHAEVDFFLGDFLQPFIDRGKELDIIVSNPPYISEKERTSLSSTVKDFDPSLALFAEEEGLAAYKTILAQAEQVAGPATIAAFEIGSSQGKQVAALIKDVFPSASVEVKKDINGQNRIVLAVLNHGQAPEK